MALIQPKSPAESQISLQQLMLPEHSNGYGQVHGGLVMKLVDEAGAIAAMRHARHTCVTVAIDSMVFHSPVSVGQLLSCRARVTYVGRSSIEVSVLVHAEEILTGLITHTNSAQLVYVALSEEGRPTAVPPLRLETDEDRDNFEAARQRQRDRLSRAGR